MNPLDSIRLNCVCIPLLETSGSRGRDCASSEYGLTSNERLHFGSNWLTPRRTCVLHLQDSFILKLGALNFSKMLTDCMTSHPSRQQC
jgi:hypothetical protein